MRGLAGEGIHYQGFLYIGLMLTGAGPSAGVQLRLGDPETQAIVARMDFDLAQMLAEVARAGILSLRGSSGNRGKRLRCAHFRWLSSKFVPEKKIAD